MGWPKEHEEFLRKMWEDEERTASDIAKSLPEFPASGKKPARAVTRDMVIGKARRMGLTSRPSPIIREASK